MTTAVITGAGSGIGRGLAQRLSAHGCPVAIVDSNPETLAATAALLDGPTLMRTLDVRDRQGQLALAAEVREWSPTPIGAVFNNAGVALTSTVGATAWDVWLSGVTSMPLVAGGEATSSGEASKPAAALDSRTGWICHGTCNSVMDQCILAVVQDAQTRKPVSDASIEAARASGRAIAVDSQGDLRRFRSLDLIKVNQAEAAAALG